MRSLTLAVALLLLVAAPVSAATGGINVVSLGIDAPVVPARYYQLDSGSWTLTVPCWDAASSLEAESNTVLFGHSYHPTCGGVFNALHNAQPGQEIAYRGQRWVVTDVHPSVKPADAHWLNPTAEPQLTLITCWPAYSSRSRLVVVARPATQPVAEASCTTYLYL